MKGALTTRAAASVVKHGLPRNPQGHVLQTALTLMTVSGT
jgi:hypothetical protein